MKSRKLAKEIFDSGWDYALYQERDPEKRIKAYRKAAWEFLKLAAEMEAEAWRS